MVAVILLLVSGAYMRDILLQAYDLAMGNGEYAFIGIELIKAKSAGSGDISWYRLGDRRNKEAKIMYEAFMVIAVRVPVSAAYNTFVFEVAKRATAASRTNRYGEEEVSKRVITW